MFTVIFTEKFSMEKYTHVPGPPSSIALSKLAPPKRILHRMYTGTCNINKIKRKQTFLTKAYFLYLYNQASHLDWITTLFW